MLQALLVIGLEYRSQLLVTIIEFELPIPIVYHSQKKTIIQEAGQISAYKVASLLFNSRRYHRIARGLDTFFKVS